MISKLKAEFSFIKKSNNVNKQLKLKVENSEEINKLP